MTVLIGLAVLMIALAIWVVAIRPRVRNLPSWQRFFKFVEPVEMLWGKSETILWARSMQLLGFVLTGLAQIGQFDLSPLMPFIPDRYKWIPAMLPLIVSVLGSIQVALRKDVSTPLEVVAMPMNAPADVKAAAADAAAANTAAIVAVETEAVKVAAADVASTKTTG